MNPQPKKATKMERALISKAKRLDRSLSTYASNRAKLMETASALEEKEAKLTAAAIERVKRKLAPRRKRIANLLEVITSKTTLIQKERLAVSMELTKCVSPEARAMV